MLKTSFVASTNQQVVAGFCRLLQVVAGTNQNWFFNQFWLPMALAITYTKSFPISYLGGTSLRQASTFNWFIKPPRVIWSHHGVYVVWEPRRAGASPGKPASVHITNYTNPLNLTSYLQQSFNQVYLGDLIERLKDLFAIHLSELVLCYNRKAFTNCNDG